MARPPRAWAIRFRSGAGRRAALLVGGVVLGQALLYGPSLVGARLLLPLDLLAGGEVYLPDLPDHEHAVPRNPAFFDRVLHYELARRFAVSEVRAGRWPLWDPHYYAGAPFVRWQKYSPFSLLSYLFPSPVTLAWLELVQALVAAGGAYLFFRRALGVGFWPAVTGAWAYPLTAWYVLWAGFPVATVTAWLPWMLVATRSAVRRPGGLGAPVLAALTALAILAGHADVAGHVLLCSGLYAAWLLAARYARPLRAAAAGRATAALLAAWALGVALAAIYWLPQLDYMRTGVRFGEDLARAEERPPEGLRALPELVLPDVYGTLETTSRRLAPGNRLESASAAYTGVLAALFLAPLAWCSRAHRARNGFLALLALVALGWVLNVPGLVALMRLPGLDLLSYNRLVFAAAFAILGSAVVGLDVLRRGMPRNRPWFAAPIVLLTVLCYACVRYALDPPLAAALEPPVRARFAHDYATGAVFAGLALAAWLLVWHRARAPSWFAPLLGAAVIAELLGFARGVQPQSDPALYYPRLPALEALREAPPGRALGMFCLPANVLESHGLSDVRGYDGVDPRQLVELLDPLLDERAKPALTPWTRLQLYTPRVAWDAASGRLELAPVLDMLGVRYLIFPGDPGPGARPLFAAGHSGHWVAENPDVLPRAFVPRRARTLAGDEEVRRLLGAADFDPRETAYVTGALSSSGSVSGSARIVADEPMRIRVEAELDAPGLVVLADRWDAGWRASVDGSPAPILRTNHVLRGVEVSAGRHTLDFRYQPVGHTTGWKVSAAAALALLAWSAPFSRSILAT